MSDDLDAILNAPTAIDLAVARMEAEIATLTMLPSLGDAATVSIAISLKRIADAVTGDEKNSGIIHALFDMATSRGDL